MDRILELLRADIDVVPAEDTREDDFYASLNEENQADISLVV